MGETALVIAMIVLLYGAALVWVALHPQTGEDDGS